MKLIHECQSCTTMESVVQGTKILTVHAFKISLEITLGISITNCETSMSMTVLALKYSTFHVYCGF